MNYKIWHPSKIINCKINLPSSKSISNRVLIIQALCDNNFTINNLSKSEDTLVLKKALNQEKEINTGHAGTSFRFLTALLSTLENNEYILNGSDKMNNRPIGELVKALKKIGANISFINTKHFPPIKIKGKQLVGGKVNINGEISSQFISALLLIAPSLKNGLELHINGKLVSKSYIKMTLSIMEFFGIKSDWQKNIIAIKPQKYIGKEFTIENDWSAATFWFQIATLSNSCKITLKNLNEESIQGDKISKDIFSKISLDYKFKNGDLILQKNNKPISFPKTINLINNPDIYQSLKTTLYALNIKTKFKGINNLIYKESNRIIDTNNELENLITKKIINTHQDHRMAMSFAPLCLKYGEIIIKNSDVVKKSYPNFWKDFNLAGFKIVPVTDLNN
ncbi:MAG: 3-phosphoshikimate 1-carboxyvinyltransferase [Flavobacteriales bacterium]|nr:3-phosphoshikimate 1-carboxyvinyltransferase [Flavobacteriales bacterium]